MAETSHGGEKPLPPSRLRSPLLRAHGAAVARYCFRKCYETWPELEARYGPRGRHFVAQDNYWHLEHLDTAAELHAPEIFEDYADWLVGLLRARGVEGEQLAGTFGFLAEGLAGIACKPQQEEHRGELIALLRAGQARASARGTPPGPDPTAVLDPSGPSAPDEGPERQARDDPGAEAQQQPRQGT
ncbi:MAG TPA: hypothetical protein VF590_17820 [Isosphaeraceae bacterium]|jgi:hypothetical protein